MSQHCGGSHKQKPAPCRSCDPQGAAVGWVNRLRRFPHLLPRCQERTKPANRAPDTRTVRRYLHVKRHDTRRQPRSARGDLVSIDVLHWVWNNSKARNGSRLVLLAIADYSSGGGWAWPSIETLASKSRLSERAVHYAIRDLQDLGELEVALNAGPGGVNMYRVVTIPGAGSAPGGGQDLHRKGADNAPRTVNEPKTFLPVQSANGHDDDVQETLDAYVTADFEKGYTETVVRRPDPRGTRLPEDWQPSRDLLNWARREFACVNLEDQTERFRDYWLSRAGAGARHTSWDRTWKNWMRRADDQARQARPLHSVDRWD